MHGFDVMPVGVEHERPVVVPRVLRSQSRWPVVASSGLQRGRVERVDLLTSVSGERDVQPANDVGRRDREVVGLLETEHNIDPASAPRTDLREPEGSQRPAVEVTTASEIAHADADVIDDDAAPWHPANSTAGV